VSDSISRLITRSRTAQPGIRPKLPALFEPLSMENVPSFDRRSNERLNEPLQDGMAANASIPQEALISEDRWQGEDSELRTERNPVSKTVILDKHGRLFSRKTYLSLHRPKENVASDRFESAIRPEFPEPPEIEPIILNTTQSEESPVHEDTLRNLLPPSAWLNASEHLTQIQTSLAARLADNEHEDLDAAGSMPPAAIASSISSIHSREASLSMSKSTEEMPELLELLTERMPQERVQPARRQSQSQQNESAFERHARRFLPPELSHPATPFPGPRQKSVSNSVPGIEIKIDRIEVQAVMPAAPPPAGPEPPPRKPSLSRDE
jgi:hypothetical protein